MTAKISQQRRICDLVKFKMYCKTAVKFHLVTNKRMLICLFNCGDGGNYK